MLKNLLLILALAILWGFSGFLVGISIDALFGAPAAFSCAAINVIAGMIMLLLVTRNEQARRIFYEGPQKDEPGLFGLGILWAIPCILIFVGVVWWLMAQLLR